MPKYAVHTIVLAEALEKLNSLTSTDESVKNAQKEITENFGIANLGAIGPDIFFWAPDYTVVQKLYKLYSNLNKLIEAYNSLVKPIKDLADKTADAATDAIAYVLPGVSELIEIVKTELKETKDLFNATLATGLFDGVVDGGFHFLGNIQGLHSISADLFNTFRPPLQDNRAIKDWYWFDMLHYRKTGDFARNLVEISQLSGSPAQRAYAYGYLSHVATDLLGHPFVNQVVGGPYRTQVQRHVTVENYMDAWVYAKKYSNNKESLFDRLNLPSTYPTEINELLFNAFQKTYPGINEHPHRLHVDGMLTQKDIKQTYEIFYKIFGLLNKMEISRPVEPFENVAEVLSSILQNITDTNPPTPPAVTSTHGCSWQDIFSFGTNNSSSQCYEEFFDNVADYLGYLGELISYGLNTLANIWNLLTTAIATLPVSVLLALLYAAQLILYDLYMTSHEALAVEGYVMPHPSSLGTSICQSLITTILDKGKYPRIYKPGTSHLIYPAGPQELIGTAPDFNHSNGNTYPDQFIRVTPFNLENLQYYAITATNPQMTRDYQEKKLRIGNAVDMTCWMISNSANPSKRTEYENILFANWNLDSDRGYAYKTWSGTIPAAGLPGPVNENYI